MHTVYIWGTGFYAPHVLNEMKEESTYVAGFVDNDNAKCGVNFCDLPVFSPEVLLHSNYDYVVVSVKNYAPIMKQYRELGLDVRKVIIYWRDFGLYPVIKNQAERLYQEIRKNRVLSNRLESYPYEIGLYQCPKILSGEKLLLKMIEDGSSLCRFGDGEFEIIRQKPRPWFQKTTEDLGKRLKEILCSCDPKINIAIAQNFISLDKYTDKAANAIREYMRGDTRRDLLELLDLDREYYDAYVTRPYIIYKDSSHAKVIFELFKKIWLGRSVLLIEGFCSRIGVGNDLFDGTKSVRRILCPSRDAWDKYEEIKDMALKMAEIDDLICVSLGPAATVLAYDMAKEGYQSVDIGQIDNEYEWYLRKTKVRVSIPGKMVAECMDCNETYENPDENYFSEIICDLAK